MERSVESKLTIYFEEPFWVGVFEELDGGKLSVCRTVFGAEPTDAQVWGVHSFELPQTAILRTGQGGAKAKSRQPQTPSAERTKAVGIFGHRHEVAAGSAKAI